MSSGIEKFITNHRGEFDDTGPSPGVWNQIEKSVPGSASHKRSMLRMYIKRIAVAASILIGVVSLYVLIERYSHEEPVSVAEPAVEETREPAGPPHDYAILLSQASQEVEQRQSTLEKAVVDFPELNRRFQEDLKVLDSTYHMLKTQAAQSVNSDVIMKAMIQNLELKSELLSRQLIILQQFKTSKNTAYEKDI